MKKTLAIILALAMMLALVACGGNNTAKDDGGKDSAGDASGEPIVIGQVGPMSGANAAVGQSQDEGVMMAVEEINAAGGIASMGGAKLEVVYADSQSDATVGVTETEKLINVEKVDMLLGSFNSAVTLPCSAVAEKNQLPWIVNSATSDAITEQGNKYTFRAYYVNATGTDQEVQMVRDLGEAQGDPIKTVSILYEDTEGGQTWATGIREAAAKYGMEIVFDEGYPAGSTDFTTPITKVKAAGADAFLLFAYTSESILVAQAVQDLEVNPKIAVGWGGLTSPEFYENDFAEGWISMQSWSADMNDPDSLAFVDAHQAKYGELAEPVAANGYNDTWMIKEVLELAGSKDADAIREAFLAIEIDGGPANIIKGTGPVVFEENGQNPNASQMAAQFNQGQWRAAWPVQYANPDYPLIYPFGG